MLFLEDINSASEQDEKTLPRYWLPSLHVCFRTEICHAGQELIHNSVKTYDILIK